MPQLETRIIDNGGPYIYVDFHHDNNVYTLIVTDNMVSDAVLCVVKDAHNFTDEKQLKEFLTKIDKVHFNKRGIET